MTTVKAAIIGGTGYGGMELLRYLMGHPSVEVSAITSRTETGAVGDVHPHLRGLTDLRFTADRAVDLAKNNDVLFFATPQGVAKKEVPDVLAASSTVRVIDLSADFRIDALMEKTVSANAAYGLPECGGRDRIRRSGCRLVANPGCHASAALLALYPLSQGDLWHGAPLASVVSITGSSGSGATPVQGTHHPERFSNFRAYKPLQHQHEDEILFCIWQYGDAQDPQVAFVPCSGPFARGIANVVTIDLKEAHALKDVAAGDDEKAREIVKAAFSKAYGAEPFVRLVPDTAEVRAVAGTNFADVGVAVRGKVVCVTVAIDNLGKGMAGTAVQNMNLLFGLDETTGLRHAGAGL